MFHLRPAYSQAPPLSGGVRFSGTENAGTENVCFAVHWKNIH
ncbi:hypothetical protein AGR6A_Cc150259 [Agrobacterium sp. NCPPB 925]|nr:hypothetical protein AGR6A_Cc150259 [Agrobacterium sp. NCPPB 925]